MDEGLAEFIDNRPGSEISSAVARTTDSREIPTIEIAAEEGMNALRFFVSLRFTQNDNLMDFASGASDSPSAQD
jgi:hypothetical protein